MKHDFCAEDAVCRISPLTEGDLESLRTWRNDPLLSRYLRPAAYITEDMEKNWFRNDLKNEQTCFFAIKEKTDAHTVGSLALYDFRDDACEIGKIMIGDRRVHGRGFGYHAFLQAMAVGIRIFGINQFHLDVHTENIPALAVYVKAGFVITGSHDFIKGGKELEMAIDRQRFTACCPAWEKIRVYRQTG